MPETDKATERELQRLRKLPENRICPNCFKEDRIGFKGVCMVYKTFVCNNCKSAHQSFSHRTKSVDMSVWKMDEVKTLDERNGGGNRAAQKTWLANVPESERPSSESSLEVYKKFIERAYIEARWMARPGEVAPGDISQDVQQVPTQEGGAGEPMGEASANTRSSRKHRHKDRSSSRRSRPPEGDWASGPNCFPVGSPATAGEELGGGAFSQVPGMANAALPWSSQPPQSASWSTGAACEGSIPVGGASPGSGDHRLPCGSASASMPPIDPTNPWVEVLLRQRLAQAASAWNESAASHGVA